MKREFFILIFIFILTSCVNTHKEIFVSEVNIETLKKMLLNKKCHNKAIFIFDPTCPTCMFYLRNEYPIMRNKYADSIDYVFISIDAIRLERYKDFFHAIGIRTGHLLYLCEKKAEYLQPNGNMDISKMMKYLFSNEEDIEIIGFPISAMTSKTNRLILECYLVNDSTSIVRPKPWHRLYLSSLDEISFDIVNKN